MKLRNKYIYAIFLLALLVIMSSGISLSRYVSTLSNTGDSSLIISSEYNLDVEWGEDPSVEQYPGISGQMYDFTLENTKNTDLNYEIKIKLGWNEETPVIGAMVPLNMELFIVNDDNTFTLVESSSINGNTLYTSSAPIEGNEVMDFRLMWNWGSSDKDQKFANKKIDVNITVNARQ